MLYRILQVGLKVWFQFSLIMWCILLFDRQLRGEEGRVQEGQKEASGGFNVLSTSS